MKICPDTSAHPRRRLMRLIMLLVMTSGCRSWPMTSRTSGTVWSRRQYGACRQALTRPGWGLGMASSSMSRPRQCGSRCRAHGEQTHSWSRSGTWSWPCDSSCTWSRPGGSSWPCGPCTRWRASSCPSRVTSLWTCSSSSSIRTDECGCASPSVHRQSWTLPLCHRDWFPPRANCAEDRCDSSVQFFGKVVLPGVVQRQVPWSEVLSREVPLLWWSRQCLWSARSCSLSTVVDISTVSQRPSWCRRCSCGFGRRCVHAAAVSSTVEMPQIPFVAFVGVSLCSEMGTQFSAVVLWWWWRPFRRILRHFSSSSGCPGVERQFFELSSAHNCECSKAPGGAGVAGSLLPGDSAPWFANFIPVFVDKNVPTEGATEQQQQHQQQQQQYNLGRIRFNRRGAATPLWGVETCSHPSRRPNPIPAIPPYVVRTPHLHGAPTTEETVKLWY